MSKVIAKPVALVMALFLTACWPVEDEGSNEVSAAPRAVKTIVAETRPAVQLRWFPSFLETLQLVPLSFVVGGRVAEVDLRVGQQVSAGELLATIEPLNLDIRLSQAEAALQEAKAAAENARSDADRQDALFERGVTTTSSKDAATARAKQADARLVQAQRNVDPLRESRADANLTATFDAVINSVGIQECTSVQAGQPVLTLFQEGILQSSILISFDVVRELTSAACHDNGDRTPGPSRVVFSGNRGT